MKRGDVKQLGGSGALHVCAAKGWRIKDGGAVVRQAKSSANFTLSSVASRRQDQGISARDAKRRGDLLNRLAEGIGVDLSN